jgi:hypothetical protein
MSFYYHRFQEEALLALDSAGVARLVKILALGFGKELVLEFLLTWTASVKLAVSLF